MRHLQTLHKVFGALFSIYYLNVFAYLILRLFFNYSLFVLPGIAEVILLVLYFLFIGIQAYRTEENRVFPILFLIMIGLILVLPEIAFNYMGFFFLVTYYYLFRTRSLFTIPMSFIAFGALLARLGLLAPIGYALMIYGWITYALKKPVKY